MTLFLIPLQHVAVLVADDSLVPGRFMVSRIPAMMWDARRAILERLYRQRLPGHQRRCERQVRAVTSPRDEDQQL
jgi:hypothetical protein